MFFIGILHSNFLISIINRGQTRVYSQIHRYDPVRIAIHLLHHQVLLPIAGPGALLDVHLKNPGLLESDLEYVAGRGHRPILWYGLVPDSQIP
jgi:hypothetical protein